MYRLLVWSLLFFGVFSSQGYAEEIDVDMSYPMSELFLPLFKHDIFSTSQVGIHVVNLRTKEEWSESCFCIAATSGG